MSLNQISVVMIARNAADTLEESLLSLIRFDEVLLYLNNSTDETRSIASKYTNVKMIEGEFIGFGDTKNQAATYAKHDWILSLDSDEILNDALLDEIAKLPLNDINTLYRLKRDNYFLGYKTESRDSIIRLYHRKITQFNGKRVHEKIMIPKYGKVKTLVHSFKHLNITHINQTLTKILQYTDLGTKNEKTCFFGIVVAKSFLAFFKTYIIQGNIFRGWVGYAIAVNSANKRHYKYLKRYINCQEEKKKQ